MKYVEIYKLQNDGSQTILATGKLVDGAVVLEGDSNFANVVTNDGIRNYAREGIEKLFPKDGLLFLEQLQYNFKSGYLNASKVEELVDAEK